MRVLAAALLAVALGWGQPTIEERVKQAPLGAEQRSELEGALAGKDYRTVERLLTPATASDRARAAELYALLGAIEFVGRRMPQAAWALGQSDALAPLGERDRFTLAMALASLGYVKMARTQLEWLNRAQPKQPLYLYWLGRLDYDQRRYSEAVEEYQRTIELDPESARAYDNLGLALDMLGRPEEALAALEKAADLNRRLEKPSAWPPQNLGNLLLRLEKLKEAEAALREALRYDSGFALAHYRLGRVLEREQRTGEALEEYRAATRLDGSLAEAYYSLGLLCRRLKRSGEAEAAFEEYRRLKPRR